MNIESFTTKVKELEKKYEGNTAIITKTKYLTTINGVVILDKFYDDLTEDEKCLTKLPTTRRISVKMNEKEYEEFVKENNKILDEFKLAIFKEFPDVTEKIWDRCVENSEGDLSRNI